MLYRYLGVMAHPVYCTKIASRLVRTFTDRHGLRDLCKDLLNVEVSKQQQSSDWGAQTLSAEQLRYAASDVLYLHALRARLDSMLAREGRMALARSCFEFLPHRVLLDLEGWAEQDIFAH
jgi:ribonuclease D